MSDFVRLVVVVERTRRTVRVSLVRQLGLPLLWFSLLCLAWPGLAWPHIGLNFGSPSAASSAAFALSDEQDLSVSVCVGALLRHCSSSGSLLFVQISHILPTIGLCHCEAALGQPAHLARMRPPGRRHTKCRIFPTSTTVASAGADDDIEEDEDHTGVHDQKERRLSKITRPTQVDLACGSSRFNVAHLRIR